MSDQEQSSLSTLIILSCLATVISLFIFISPLLAGKKEPGLQASVLRNMEQFHEIVQKYIDRHKTPPTNLSELLKDAKNNHYNKTLYNPLLLSSGNLDDSQIITKYDDVFTQSLNTSFSSKLYQGKVGYYTWDNLYVIYGHMENGELLTRDGKIFSFSNQ